MLNQQQYDDLMNGTTPFIVIMPDGEIMANMIIVNRPTLQIVSGSFNPLHMGHKRLFHNASHQGTAYYEVSITRDGKEFYTLAELNRIVKQFAWVAPIIITASKTFAEKRRLFSKIPVVCFHIGTDTAERIKRDYSPEEIAKNNLNFYVYQRGDTQIIDDHDYNLFHVNEDVTPYTIEARNISSTELRNAASRI